MLLGCNLSESVVYIRENLTLFGKRSVSWDLIFRKFHLLLANLKNILHLGGSSLGQVLKVKIFMTNLGQFGESKSARTYIEVSISSKEVHIGIEAIGHIAEVS